MTEETITAYVTKYALTQGILKIQAKRSLRNPERIIQKHDTAGVFSIYHKNQWYETEQEAREHALQMKSKKLVNLRKQIDKLNKLEIKVVEPKCNG